MFGRRYVEKERFCVEGCGNKRLRGCEYREAIACSRLVDYVSVERERRACMRDTQISSCVLDLSRACSVWLVEIYVDVLTLDPVTRMPCALGALEDCFDGAGLEFKQHRRRLVATNKRLGTGLA